MCARPGVFLFLRTLYAKWLAIYAVERKCLKSRSHPPQFCHFCHQSTPPCTYLRIYLGRYHQWGPYPTGFLYAGVDSHVAYVWLPPASTKKSCVQIAQEVYPFLYLRLPQLLNVTDPILDFFFFSLPWNG